METICQLLTCKISLKWALVKELRALNLPNSHTIYGLTCPWVTFLMNTLPRLCEQADRMHLWTRRRHARFCNIIAWSGGRMQDWSIRVCVPEACEVWKCLPGLASIMLQYAWWCSLTLCVYIFSTAAHTSILNNNIANSYVKHGSFLRDFFLVGF